MNIEPKLNVERYNWLKQQLGTDLLNLDEEVAKMSQLVQDVGENVALANELRDAAKENWALVAAQISAKLRVSPLESGKPRSETQVTSESTLDPAYIEAQTQNGDARLDASLWTSLRDAIQQKSYSLNTTVELIKCGYLTMDAIINKRRKEIRGVTTPVGEK